MPDMQRYRESGGAAIVTNDGVKILPDVNVRQAVLQSGREIRQGSQADISSILLIDFSAPSRRFSSTVISGERFTMQR